MYCPSEVWHSILFEKTHIDHTAEFRCIDQSIGFIRHCDSLGNWEKPQGSGCQCPQETDENGILWKQIQGGSVVQRACVGNTVGMIVRNCSPEGRWFYVQGSCETISCPQNRSHEILWPATPGGQTVNVTCASSSSIAMLRKCNNLGQWEAVQERPCFCPEVVEQNLLWPQTQGGVVQSLRCPPSYTGSISRACNKLGHWETIQQRCIRIVCPVRSEYGLTFPRTESGLIATAPCPFPFTGQSRRICKHNGEWGYLFDECQRPSCSEFRVVRDKIGCVSVDVLNRTKEELIQVEISPKPTSISALFDATLPATICGLDVNTPFNLYLSRFENVPKQLGKYSNRQFTAICRIRHIYGKQQCENVTIPLLQERLYDGNSSLSTNFGIKVVLKVPFCYDLSIASLQLKIECIHECANERPRIMAHTCSNEHPCQPGSSILISSPLSLSTASTYSIAARAIPARSLLAVPSFWSYPLIITPLRRTVIQPVLQAIPKSSHVLRLEWKVDDSIPFVNFLIHIFISSPLETTFDPRYLRFLDTQMLCSGTEPCERHNLVFPLTNNDYRYVFILQSFPVDSQNITVRNVSVAYQVPHQPSVLSFITNYDVFANISFSQSNMDVLVNCSVYNSNRHLLSTFSVAVDYGQVVWYIVNDLQPQSQYSALCWVRDGFIEAQTFNLSFQTVSFVPTNSSMVITRTTKSYVVVDLLANKHGQFHCMAMYTHDKGDLQKFSISYIEEHGVILNYLVPLQLDPLYIPLLHSEEISEPFDDEDDLNVYVICTYFPMMGNVAQLSQGKIMRLRGRSPTG